MTSSPPLLDNGVAEETPPPPKDIDQELERQHCIRIINAFRNYKNFSLQILETKRTCFNNLKSEHQALIPQCLEHLDQVQLCIEHNYEVIKRIVDKTDIFENSSLTDMPNKGAIRPKPFDMEKVRTTLKQFVRDWSSHGESERRACYEPVITEITNRFPHETTGDLKNVKVLVPGAGCGRLAYEIASMGYSCQGNEWSLFMIFASHFVLNKCPKANMFTLAPIVFPDICPADDPPSAEFSMAAGDFLEVYTTPSQFDCVATVFFIDTAHNVIDYIETIYKILKPGSFWINIGPLLYHYADVPGEPSIELAYSDVKDVVRKCGFELLKEETNVKCSYIQSQNSMLKYEYDCVFFVAQKPLLGGS